MADGEQRYQVYVIRLKNTVWEESPKYRKENPQYHPGKPHVYVGSTGKTPEERFETHMDGGPTSSPFVRRFGKRLFDWAHDDAPLQADRARVEELEAEWAEKLRQRGWGVWYNARPLEENLGEGPPGGSP